MPEDVPGATRAHWLLTAYRAPRAALFTFSVLMGMTAGSVLLSQHFPTLFSTSAALGLLLRLAQRKRAHRIANTWTTTVTPDGWLYTRLGGSDGPVQRIALDNIARVDVGQASVALPDLRRSPEQPDPHLSFMAVGLTSSDGTATTFVPLRLLEGPTGLLPAIRTHTIGRQTFLDNATHPLAKSLFT